jgi:hypothetical protein
MDLAMELSEATARVWSGGTVGARLAEALAALMVARRAITVLEEEGDPAGFAGYAMAAIEIVEAGHAVRRAPALETLLPVDRANIGHRTRSTAEGAEVRALIVLAEVLEEEFTKLSVAVYTVNDQLACLTAASHAARWRDTLAPGDTDGDLR